MNLIEFLLRNRAEVFELILEHLFLVFVSTGVAIAIGVPLGILLTRKPALSNHSSAAQWLANGFRSPASTS